MEDTERYLHTKYPQQPKKCTKNIQLVPAQYASPQDPL